MNCPLISVVVPVFNNELYLAECLDSILSQTYKNLQIILVNDGSTDSSLSICLSYKAKDNRVVVIDQQNQGVSKARNAGMEAADGEYVGFVDSDDFIKHDMYEKLLSRIDGADCAVLRSFTVRPPSGKKTAALSISGQAAIEELFLLRFPTSMCAYLYKTDIAKKVQLSEDVHFFEDFEFNFNYLQLCNVVALCDEVLYCYRNNPMSINKQQINEKQFSCLKLCEKKVSLERLGKVAQKKFFFFKAHCLISLILSYARSGDSKRVEYKLRLKTVVRDSLRYILFSRYVPLTYKSLLIIFSASPSFAVGTIRMVKRG